MSPGAPVSDTTRPVTGAGTSTADADPASWVYVPKGLCEKLTGGSLEPKA